MKIIEFESLDSTQTYLISLIKNNEILESTCIIAKMQHNGIGSRGNKWISVKKGLYFSFCFKIKDLPSDLEIQSLSIFFGFIFKETLKKIGSKVWLKWPNDLYLDENKIGGIICSLINDFAVCGIGINLKSLDFATIEDTIKNSIIKNNKEFLRNYFKNLESYSWSEVFNKYKLEFYKNDNFSFHHKNQILYFKDSELLKDGSILINNEIIYSAR